MLEQRKKARVAFLILFPLPSSEQSHGCGHDSLFRIGKATIAALSYDRNTNRLWFYGDHSCPQTDC